MISWQSIFASCLLFCWWYGTEVCGQDFNPLPRSQRQRPTTSAVLPRTFSSNSIVEAFQTADENIARRRTAVSGGPVLGRRRPMDQQVDAAAFRHNLFQRSRPRTVQLENNQERFEEATRVLLNEFNLTPQQIAQGLAETDLQSVVADGSVQQCRRLFNVTNCDNRARFRTFDGTCNNLDHPSWGMASSCFERLLDPVYDDGISEMRNAVSGRELPLPRTISLELHSHIDNPTEYVTHMHMQWGQFLDHDISLSPLDQTVDNEQLRCCPPQDDDPGQCAPILLENDDPFFGAFGIDCLENVRTVICSTCALGARHQTNQLTAFIDGSMIYGTSTNESNGIRDLDGAGTLTSITRDNSELLPTNTMGTEDGCSFQVDNETCFRGGDPRINQHVALTSFHIVFLRHHNRIARRLRTLNRRWGEERLFQETRRIVGAQLQMITYNEFLHLVIGPERMQWFDLAVQQESRYTQYDESVDPTLVNEFSTAAFRFGHSMVNSFFAEISRQSTSGNRLRDLFLWPFDLYRRGHLERIVRGMFRSPGQKFDRYMIRDLTNHLYQLRGNQSGLDLASLNVLRGRDHGIPPYVQVVNFCGGPNITTFRQLDRLFQRGYSQRFQSVYESVYDIDLFSGGLAERPNQGAIVGPTFTCIIGIQFYHLKYGDRFYFEHAGQTGSFTPEQLRELKKTTFAKIICDNTDIRVIQREVMVNPSRNNPEMSCQDLPSVNLEAWSR